MKLNFIQKMKEKTRTFFVALKEKIRGYYKGHGYTCDACGGEVFDYPTHRFCVNCEGKLFQNVGKICPKCGRRTLAAGVCLACKSHTPSFTFGYSPFVYRAETAALINRMKNGAPMLSFYFSEKMAEYFLTSYQKIEHFKGEEKLLVIPVPLTKERRQVRGYNQAELLAEGFCEYLQARGYAVEMDLDVLQKTRETGQQKHLDKKSRRENASGAYHVHKRKECKDRTIVLIDDIMTSGATGSECAARLKGAGAKEVLFVVATALSELK